jgi:DNA-binding LacI/PurR family transcriptional regulator
MSAREAADAGPHAEGSGTAANGNVLTSDGGKGSSTRPPSIRDVARSAGVAFQTVSRVINNSSKVAPDTRARVLAAIDELGYRPNAAARALASGRSRIIGVLSIGTNAFETPSTLDGIDQAASAAGYSILFSGTHSQDAADIKRAVESLLDQQAAGCILIAPRTTTDLDAIDLPAHVPVVLVEGDPRGGRPRVNLDQALGARVATEHLLDLGHHTVWHVSGPRDWYDSLEREAGWRAALEERGITPPPLLSGDWHHASGYECGRIIAAMPDATAVFVANDSMALGLLHALHEAGKSVPEDVSVIGFDDLDEAEFACPPLTTVRQEFFDIGRASLELLLGLVERGEEASKHAAIAPEFIERRSTCAPAKRPTAVPREEALD